MLECESGKIIEQIRWGLKQGSRRYLGPDSHEDFACRETEKPQCLRLANRIRLGSLRARKRIGYVVMIRQATSPSN